MLDYGIFFDLIPMDTYGTPNEKVLPIWEVALDTNYAIVITTNAGWWRYLIGDTVRCTSKDPDRIKVTGRTKHQINVFGEELIIENAEEALERACKITGAEIIDYTAGPVFMQGRDKGAHEWIIEFRKMPESLDVFSKELDLALQSVNSDY